MQLKILCDNFWVIIFFWVCGSVYYLLLLLLLLLLSLKWVLFLRGIFLIKN